MVMSVKKQEREQGIQLDQNALKALSDGTRVQILQKLSRKPLYPSKIAEELDITKQKVHYHFKELKKAGLIEKVKEEKRSGGLATYYQTTNEKYIFNLNQETGKEQIRTETGKFLQPLISSNNQLKGKIVVGSPDKHGPDQVRARDGHLAGEIGLKLGQYTSSVKDITKLDTEITRESKFNHNLILLGGILTNTVSKKYNEEFPVKFQGRELPYRKIITKENEYTGDSIGVISKTQHPSKQEKALYLIAGIRQEGTKAAVKAFKDLEDIIEEYKKQDCYIIVEGKDMDGDGKIDNYKLLEKKGL